MDRYELIRSTTIEYDRRYVSYGIKVIHDGRCVRIIRDISTDKAALSSLIADLNTGELDALHLDQVIEDFLCGV